MSCRQFPVLRLNYCLFRKKNREKGEEKDNVAELHKNSQIDIQVENTAVVHQYIGLNDFILNSRFAFII